MTSLVSDAQLERYLSVFGVTSFADHDDDGVADTSVVDDCKTFGTSFIVGWLSQRYTYANLVNSQMLPEITAIVVLRELCLRRGNAPPASLELRYQELVREGGDLDRIASGKLPLVDSNGNRIAQRNGGAPSHANITVDRRFAEKKLRVITGSSNLITTTQPRHLDRLNEVEQ